MRGRLLCLTIGLGLPFLVYMGIGLQQTLVAEQAHSERAMRDLASLTAVRLDSHLRDLTVVLNTVAQSLGDTVHDPQRSAALLKDMAAAAQLPDDVNNLSVWALDGRNIASLYPSVAVRMPSIADRGYFKEVLQSGQLAIEAPIVSKVNGEPVAVLAVPVQQAQQMRAVAVVSIRLERLQALLDPAGRLPTGAVITLLTRDGTILARSLDPRAWIGRRMPSDPLLHERLSSNSPPGTFERISFDGKSRLFGYAPAKAAPWTVFVGLPTELATAPARERLQHSLFIGSVLLLLGLLSALWVGERSVRQLRQLAADAATIGRGELGHRSGVRGPHEIELLADTLNDMARSLQQREAALQDTQALLRKVTDHVPALVSLLDADERFTFANRAYEDWLGMAPEQLLGRSLREFSGEEVYDAHIGPHMQLAWQGQHTAYERRMGTRHGERWVRVSLVPRADADGRIAEICAMVLDVTERYRAEERLNLAIEGSGLGLFDWDLANDRLYHSAQAVALRGAPAIEEVAAPQVWRDDVHPDDVPALLHDMKRAIKGEQASYSAEFRLRHASGEQWLWVRSQGRVVERGRDGRALRLAGTYADITERRAAEDRLKHLAQYDHLTGLPNRALFHDRLQQAVQRAQRSGRPMAVMFLDIDHFKRVNDSLGHEAGDELLKAFASRLTDGVRRVDTVARLAGDEFTVIAEDLTDPQDAGRMALALVEAARQPVCLGASVLRISTSVGVAVWTQGEVDGIELLRRADAALYEAKRQGRDGCHVAPPWQPSLVMPRVDAAA